MTTPTTPLPMPIRLLTDRDTPAGTASFETPPCADAGRCDRASCGHAERVERHCPSPENRVETPL